MLHRDFLRARRGSTSESHPTPPTHGRKARPNTARHSSTIACSTPLSSVAGSSLASITALTGSANTSSMSATPHTARCRGEGGAFQDELSIAPRPPVNQPSEAFARHMSSSSLASGTHPPVSSPAEKVSVAVRCRPPNPEQGERQEDVIVSMDPRSREVYLLDEGSHKWRVDTPIWSCRGPARDGSATSTQAQIYEQVGRPLLLHALDGYNSTLMAYGQTGSGKTYTMMGGLKLSGEFREESAEYGLVPRICYDLFEEIDRRSFTAPSGETLSWEVHVRFVEIYCERISDLLNGGASISIREEITSDAASFVLLGATRIRAHNTVDLLRALNTGNKCRKTASTKSNERSSRSHAIFIMELTEILSFVEPDGSVVSAPSKSLAFRLVDLAGSERVSETGVMGQQLKEARDINLSLFTLGMVIESLTDKRRCIKPPYRDSALTKLLRDAFGGNSKTTMICTIGPCEAHRQQTIQTLNYAAKARRVLNKPHVDEDPSAAELRRANAELLNLRRELVDAQKSGTHHAQIEAQLKEAHDRLRRDQAEARERKLALEKRESALAARLREVEAQRQLYESQMSALEQEAERAKAEQTKREQDLNRAYRQAEKSNQLRLVELQRQQDASEHALKAKEEELIQHQREVEGKLQKMELQSRHRVDELLRQQREVEAEFRRREEEAKQKEREIASRQRKAEEDARQREEHIRGMEEEWTKHVQCIEEEFRSREDSIAKRMKEAQERLKLAEDEARVREGEMKERWSEAEQQARRLQTEMERKQAELDRRVLELNRQAQQRELELNHKLHDAEYQLHRREKESQHHQEEVELLKEEAARQSASVLFKEKSWQEQQSILTDSLRLREEQIRRREAELSAQFDELMNTRGNWERDYAAKVAVLQVSHDETAVALKQKESVLQQRDQELHQLRADFESQSAAKEMDFKRKELALLAQMNEGEARAQRERHINLRSKEDVQRAMDKVVSENHQREEKLRRWEEELTERRTKLEQQLLDREAHVLRREQALSGTREGLSEKLAEVDLLIQQHTAEQAVLREKMAEEESERKRQHTEQMEALQRRIADVDVGRPSRESICGAPSRCCLEHEQLALALQQMSRREVANLVAIETLYRLSIRGDEDVQSQFIAKSQRLESREINRQEAFVELTRQHQRAHASLERVQHECLRLSTQMEESTSQLRIQQADNERLQEELMNLRIQRSSALSTAACADETSQRIRQDAMDALEAHRQELQSMSEQLRSARDESDQSTEKYLRLSCAALLMLTQLEEQQRYLLEHHAGHERLAMKKLEISDMESNAKNRSIEQWKCLYREKDSNHLEAAHLAVLDAQRLDLRTRLEEELKLRETAVAERENIVERREHQLQRQAQDRPSTRAVDQLHESEIRVAAKEVELHEREENLVQLAIRLKEKESVLTSRLYEAQQNLIRHTALQLVELYHSQERVERESIRRLADLHYERCVCGTLDATSTHQQLRIRRDAAVAAESVALEEKMAQSEAENARRRKQLADEELQLQAYLRALQMEDIRRAELSEKGQAVVEEAEARLAQARQREEAMEALARRVQLQALSAEEEVKEKECSLQKRSIDLQRRMKERYAELERKQQVVRSQTEGFQRELQDLEMELCSIIYKNKNAELELRSKDGELQRQKMYYADLTKTLEERERLLKLERAHRADGFRSATSLAGDLLDVNDLLKKQLLIWRRKFDVLHAQDKLECEHCAWLNRKDALKCRCCGNALLPASDSH